MITLILAGETVCAAYPAGTVQAYPGGWVVPGDGDYPAASGVTGTADVPVTPSGFSPAGYLWRDGALIARPVTAQPGGEVTALAFRGLFTDAEIDAITAASLASPALRKWLDAAGAAQVINLADAEVAAGIGTLVAAGLLTADRADQVQAGQVPS